MQSSFKAFVTEKEVDEIKKKRQEEWERVRKPHDPLERPEEKPDYRTLYEKLKSQRDSKQEEWEEQFKFKNMIYKGLDEEEAQFLQQVANRQTEEKDRMWREEHREVLQYREAVSHLRGNESSEKDVESERPNTSDRAVAKKNKDSPAQAKKGSSQLALLSGSIRTKRKRSRSASHGSIEESSSSKTDVKKAKEEDPCSSHQQEDSSRTHFTPSVEDDCDGGDGSTPHRALAARLEKQRSASASAVSALSVLAGYSSSSDSQSDTGD